VCGWQVKLCDPLVTHGPYLSALEIKGLYIKRYIYIFICLLFYYNQHTIKLQAKAEKCLTTDNLMDTGTMDIDIILPATAVSRCSVIVFCSSSIISLLFFLP